MTDNQKKQVRLLAETCCRAGNFSLSYPLDEEDGAALHCLLYRGTCLAAALAVIPASDSDGPLAECVAFTLPGRRNQGCFSALLDAALEQYEECDILFPVSGQCPDTMAALEAIGAEFCYDELQMERDLETCEALADAAAPGGTAELKLKADTTADFPAGSLAAAPANSPDNPSAIWSLHLKGLLIGTCRTTTVSDGCVCLHHVEILPEFRGQGYGFRMINLLLPALSRRFIQRVILHVSGSNEPAVSLYKKTGFRVTETLSYYLY